MAEDVTTDEVTDEDVQDYFDEAEDDIDESTDIRDSQFDSYAETTPSQAQKQDLYSWFWKVVRLKKPLQLAKVGNLNNTEIGQQKITMRDALNLWVLGNTFHHPTFGRYFAQISKITSTTSMARQGWFMDLSISQKKVRERKRQSSSGNNEQWKIFKKRREQAQP